MICSSCKTAGLANATGIPHAAARFHKECLHPSTCTCAHKTGDGHRKEEVKHANQASQEL
jgi:hypothetical protein